MSSRKSKQLFDEKKYKNPFEALDKASADEWAKACADMLWLQLRERSGALQAFIAGGFEQFRPIAKREYSGHGFRDRHIRMIFNDIAIRAGGSGARI